MIKNSDTYEYTYLRLSILELSKTLTHEFLYDYVKQIFGEKEKL